MQTVLVHLASGIGNIVLATPLLRALHELDYIIDVLLSADYAQTADLLCGWSILRTIRCAAMPPSDLGAAYDHVLAAVPPFYWPRYAGAYRRLAVRPWRPPDADFYRDEQEYYLSYARHLGYPRGARPSYALPIGASDDGPVGPDTVVLAPGCKTGEMAAKRWPHFPELAERYVDVAVVGTSDDLLRADGTAMHFPAHVRMLVDALTLRETAALLAAAGVVVGNDSGLSHIAGAVGAPTLMLFGPTPDRSLGALPPNVTVLRAGLTCEPCWYGGRLRSCAGRIDCLRTVSIGAVERCVRALRGDGAPPPPPGAIAPGFQQ